MQHFDKEAAPLIAFVQEEIASTLNETASQILERLPPITRLRLLAFMSLIDDPQATKALLDVDSSGRLRLTLAAYGVRSANQGH
ncbi:hypothetical protein [Microvirga alba]|uniref:Uncharacterized protein n=1 Tax=Microvirga alba TaxID=2791025 RepID=A0A931BV94_9HYPH|nr:hypothetical protein [Microvirga alba]MBF9234475.1 hypothetical protein [Microvirga alba]